MSALTAVVLTKDEEAYIADCLESLKWCDKVIALDSLSTDRTVEIAHQHGAQTILRPFTDFADQRNAALELIDSDWVLFVDADEQISTRQETEISQAMRNPQFSGYWIPTHNYQMGKLILHAGLYPDYHLRLFRKRQGHYDPDQKVHEHVCLDGAESHLNNPLIHISCDTWSDFRDHQKHWARLKAKVHFARGVRPSYHFIVGPTLEFLRRYVYLQGYLDGLHGLYLSSLFAYYYFVMYVHLGKMWKTDPPRVGS